MPRERRFEVNERMNYKGESVAELDLASVDVVAEKIRASGANAVAVSFLHSYANPSHERECADRLREMLPDVAPTIDGLVERVASLAITLQRLDADVSGTSLGALDERIALAERDTRDADNDRRLALLRRQRTTLHDLLERRRTLLDQMESAGLTLQNLKLDLLKLRSAGVGSAIEDVTSATREARALSRDIEHLLDAADDVRKL